MEKTLQFKANTKVVDLLRRRELVILLDSSNKEEFMRQYKILDAALPPLIPDLTDRGEDVYEALEEQFEENALNHYTTVIIQSELMFGIFPTGYDILDITALPTEEDYLEMLDRQGFSSIQVMPFDKFIVAASEEGETIEIPEMESFIEGDIVVVKEVEGINFSRFLDEGGEFDKEYTYKSDCFYPNLHLEDEEGDMVHAPIDGVELVKRGGNFDA